MNLSRSDPQANPDDRKPVAVGSFHKYLRGIVRLEESVSEVVGGCPYSYE